MPRLTGIVWLDVLTYASGFIIAAQIVCKFVFGFDLRVDRPLRWLSRQLVGDPITRWAQRITSSAVESTIAAEFRPNGGGTLRDAIDNIAKDGSEDRRVIRSDLEELRRQFQREVDYNHSGIHAVRDGLTAVVVAGVTPEAVKALSRTVDELQTLSDRTADTQEGTTT